MDSYEIGKELGSGAFSVVKSAIHKVTQEVVAIKILDKYEEDDEQTQKFRQEIKIISSLIHENIVQFYRLDEDEENFYVIMELIGGGELFDYIISTGMIKEPDAVCVIAQVCKAIEYMHSVGIIHRDLKPENLLFKDMDHKVIKIADFGESRSFKEGQLNTYCGTPDYMAPEIIRGESYGPEVDIWSIGVITYVMLSGFPPFDGENDIEVFASILSVRYDFPSPEWNKISQSAKTFIQSILLENPKQRLTASGCLSHPWLTENVPLELRSNVKSGVNENKLIKNIDGSLPVLDLKKPKTQLKEMIEEMNRNEGYALFSAELKVIMTVLDATGKLPLNDFEKVIYKTYFQRLQEIQNHFKKSK
jgi:calcium/calmodulin-dependent protein kinase I